MSDETLTVLHSIDGEEFERKWVGRFTGPIGTAVLDGMELTILALASYSSSDIQLGMAKEHTMTRDEFESDEADVFWVMLSSRHITNVRIKSPCPMEIKK